MTFSKLIRYYKKVERERDRQRDRDRETDRERERQTDRDRETGTERQRETERGETQRGKRQRQTQKELSSSVKGFFGAKTPKNIYRGAAGVAFRGRWPGRKEGGRKKAM